VRAAQDDGPPPGSRARALARIEAGGALGAAARAAARGSFRGSGALLGLGGGLVLAAAAAALVVSRGHLPARPASVVATAERLQTPDGPHRAPPPAAPRARVAPGPAAPAAGREPSSCERVVLDDREPSECSRPGHQEEIEVLNTCGEDVDVFWVDFKCRESFVKRLAPGDTLRQHTYDTHPWRVRDHATHRLVKEWVGPTQPELPSQRVPLPDQVITDRAGLREAPPAVCSFPSDPATIRFVNERTRGVSVVFWVDYDCQERLYHRLEPGETWTQETYAAHPWRVRDEGGALLLDFAPDGQDNTVYISVP
jgi:hypothetical protein